MSDCIGGHQRIVYIRGKVSDMFSAKREGGGDFYEGYVPRDMGIGGGDHIKFEYCLDCLRIQGDAPLPKTWIEKGFKGQRP